MARAFSPYLAAVAFLLDDPSSDNIPAGLQGGNQK